MSGRTKESVVEIGLDLVNADERLQMRAEGVDPQLVEEYAETPDDLAPIEVWHDEEQNTYWVSDGHHTVAAYRKLGRATIRAKVHTGTFDDAEDAAYHANSRHGNRRTRETVRAVVLRALNNPRHKGKSNRELGRLCGVVHQTIANIKNELQAKHLKEEERKREVGQSAPGAAEPPMLGVAKLATRNGASNDKDLGDETPPEASGEESGEAPKKTPLEAYNGGIDAIVKKLNEACSLMREVFGIKGGEITSRYARHFFSNLSTEHDCRQLCRTIRDGKVADILPDGTPVNAREAKNRKGAA